MNAARKLILVSASLPLFAAPIMGHASENAAMDACVNAFVSANLPKEQKVRLRTIEQSRSPMDVHTHYYTISLSARGADSGKQVASATCIVKHDGTLVSMNGKAIATPELASLSGR